jgi:hypothetical protein
LSEQQRSRYLEGKSPAAEAVNKMSTTYLGLVDLWRSAVAS